MRIRFNYSNFKIDIELRKNSILFDDSGTGKSFFFEMFTTYLRQKGIKYLFVNYKNKDFNFKDIDLSKYKYIILDNYDLYSSIELSDMLLKSKCYVLISVKNLVKAGIEDYRDICVLRIENDCVVIDYV